MTSLSAVTSDCPSSSDARLDAIIPPLTLGFTWTTPEVAAHSGSEGVLIEHNNMSTRRRSTGLYHSAGKVTVGLLLFFLAISPSSLTTAAAHLENRQGDSAQIPILPPSLSPEDDHAIDQTEDTLQFVSACSPQ